MKTAIVLLAAVFALVGCSSTSTAQPTTAQAPTPVVIYVTPEPTAIPQGELEVPTPEPVEPVVEEATEPPAVTGLVPLGKWATVGDWKIRFTKTNWNAWKAIHAANMFNEAPPAGYRDVMSWVEYQYLGDGRGALDPMFTFRSVGVLGTEYSQFEDPTCGVLPAPDAAMDDKTLRHDGKAKGWVCWTIENGDAKSLYAFTSFLSDFDDSAIVEFALR